MRLKVRWNNGWAYAHGTAPDGKRVRRALGTQDPRRAEEARASLEARLWRVKLYGPEAVLTFGDAALAYANDGGDVRFIEAITTQLNTMPLKSITPKEIRDAARRAYPNASPATWNRQGVTPARAVINYAHAQGWCAPVKVKSFDAPKPRRRAVGREYLDALRPHMPPRAFAVLLFLHTTGRRVGDAIGLAPEDRDGGRVAIGRTKNGDPATAVLTAEVAAILDSEGPRHGRLFGYVHRSSLYSTMRRAAEKAGLPYLGTHQIGRHSFATALDAAGWSPKRIADAGGWKSVRMVSETYTHPDQTLMDAAAVLDKKSAKRKARPSKNA